MRGRYISAGLACIIIGIMLLMIGIYAINGFINLNHYTGTSNNTIAWFGQIVGSILIVIGILSGIAGAALPNKIKIQQSSVVTQTKTMQQSAGSPEAVHTLMTRYAKGEITKEQYEQMKKDIEMKEV